VRLGADRTRLRKFTERLCALISVVWTAVLLTPELPFSFCRQIAMKGWETDWQIPGATLGKLPFTWSMSFGCNALLLAMMGTKGPTNNGCFAPPIATVR
jgi:hypothetical protein